MKRLVCLVLALAASAAAQDVAEPALQAELAERLAADQDVRMRLIATGAFNGDGLSNPTPEVSALLVEMMTTDADNLAFVEALVAEHGWPTPALVGTDGVSAVWYIVQHSYLEVQERMLPLVEAAWTAGDLPGEKYALLLDRVLVGRGERQVYGTQPDMAPDGTLSIPATTDDATLDVRRAEVGLPPIAVYMDALREMYQSAPAEGE